MAVIFYTNSLFWKVHALVPSLPYVLGGPLLCSAQIITCVDRSCKW